MSELTTGRGGSNVSRQLILTSHFHRDHVGGLAALIKMIPVGRFFDHSDTIEKENQEWLDSYHAASAGRRTIVKAGDEIPLKGVQVQVVSSDQHVIAKAVNGGGARNRYAKMPRRKRRSLPRTSARSDCCSFRGNRGVQGELDQGVGRAGRQVHRHERPQRIQQKLHRALTPICTECPP
jgi:ribonuclease BN (tRNA processing enzyme)